MMAVQSILLDDVLAQPWDEDLRGIYADYLEDSGDPLSACWREPAPQKVERLAPWQAALMPAVRDCWLKIGLATGPADRVGAWEAACEAYRMAGLEPPTTQVWLDSPLAGAMGAAELVGAGAQVRAQVRDQVRAQVVAQVWDQVWAQVRAQVWAQVGDQVRAQVGRCGYGQHDAGWLSFYAYFMAVTRLDCCRRLVPLMKLAECCGWWWPFEGAIIFTERPSKLEMKGGKLVRVEYPDGFAVCGNG